MAIAEKSALVLDLYIYIYIYIWIIFILWDTLGKSWEHLWWNHLPDSENPTTSSPSCSDPFGFLALGCFAPWMEMPETAFVLGRVAQLVDDPKKMNTIHELEFSDHIEDTCIIMV